MKYGFFSRLRRQRGASGTEYGLLVGLIAMTSIVTLGQMGGGISGLFKMVADTLLGKRIELSASTVAENMSAGTVVGSLSFKGVVANEGATFTTTDSRFSIAGTTLITAAVFDYEAQHAVSIPVTAHVEGTDDFTQNLIIDVGNVNETPAAPVLSCAAGCTQVPENSTTVGTVTASDPDGDALTYSLPVDAATLASFPDNSLLTLTAAGVLSPVGVLDYDNGQRSYTLWVVAQDAANHTQGGMVTFSLANVLDEVAAVTLTNGSPSFSLDNSASIDATSGVVYVDQTLTFKNTGEIATTGFVSPTLTDLTHFEVVGGTCQSTILSPKSANSCTVVVRAKTATNGTLTGSSLQVGGTSVALSGSASGLTAALVLDAANPTTVSNFTAASHYSDCTALAVKNTGHLLISSAITGSLSGTNATNFETCTASSNACGSTLAIGASCNLGVKGKALINGTYAATVTANVTEVSTSPTQSMSLTATGITYAKCQDALTWAGTLGLTAADGRYNTDSSPILYCDMTTDGGGWTMVYKHSTGVAADVYTAFTSGATAGSVPTSKTSKDASDYINRSLISTYVASTGKIRLSVHKGGAEVRYMRFNGTGNVSSWFGQSALEAASWSELKTFNASNMTLTQRPGSSIAVSSHVKFDMVGEMNWDFSTIFQWGQCVNDAGWFVVVSPSNDGCNTRSFAAGNIRYSDKLDANNNPTWNYLDLYALADSMAIWIR